MAVVSTSVTKSEELDDNKQSKEGRLAFMLRALRYRNYRLFFCGQIISLLGTWITQIATTWTVYALTHSAFWLGAVAFAGQLPAFLLSPIAGVWVDRWPRHRLLLVTQFLAMLQSFALAGVTLSHYLSKDHLWVLVALLAFQGLINAFDMPGRQAFVIEMIENKEDLSNAIALNSSMFNMARLLGPTVGAIIIAAVGAGWCFLIDGFSYLAVLGCLLAMKVLPHKAKTSAKAPIQELKEGYRYAFGFAPIRSLLILMAASSLIGMPYTILMPVIASETLHGKADTLGYLMAASGCGALVSALVLAARQSVRGLGKLIPYCTFGFAVSLALFSHVTVIWLALPLLFGVGFFMMQQNAACNTLLQTIVDSDKRGRVMSLYTMAFMGMAPLGSLWAGTLADYIGAANTLLIAAVASSIIGFWFLRQLPALRPMVRPIYERLGIIPEVAAGVDNVSELSRPPQPSG